MHIKVADINCMKNQSVNDVLLAVLDAITIGVEVCVGKLFLISEVLLSPYRDITKKGNFGNRYMLVLNCSSYFITSQ